MHIVEILLHETVAQFFTHKFGEIFIPEEITMSQGMEALMLKSKINEILEVQHIKRWDRNQISPRDKKTYKIASPYRHITGYQNRMIDQVCMMYFRHELAWHLTVSRHIYMKDKIDEFIDIYDLYDVDDVYDRIQKIIEKQRNRRNATVSV